jgi:xanthine dehydrogenase accessory factor
VQRHAALARSWVEQGRTAAVVRVIDAAGLGPRPTEEVLLVDDAGRTDGSLLGGVVDEVVTAAARGLLATPDRHTATLKLDVAEEDAGDAGLTCGGYVHLLVQRLDDVPVALWDALADGRPAALTTTLDENPGAVVHRPGQPPEGTLGSPDLDEHARTTAAPLLARPGHHVSRDRLDETELLVEVWHPVPRLVVVGASAFSDALVAQVQLLGWPGRVVTALDEALTAVAGLSTADLVVVVDHDHDLATPVLAAALRGPASYVGGLGSRHTQAERRARLAGVGITDEEMAAYHGPTGLDLGARTPAETAVSIVAEVLAVRSGRTPTPLEGSARRIGGG